MESQHLFSPLSPKKKKKNMRGLIFFDIRRLQRSAHHSDDPHGDADPPSGPSALARQLVLGDGAGSAQKGDALALPLRHQRRVAGDDQGADFEIEAVAARRVVGGSDRGDGWVVVVVGGGWGREGTGRDREWLCCS